MESNKPKIDYKNYFIFGKPFDKDRFINDLLTNCITNNIKDANECFLFNNVQPILDDYKTLESNFNNLQKYEPIIKDCIKTNQTIYNCDLLKSSNIYNDFRATYSLSVLFNKIKSEQGQ